MKTKDIRPYKMELRNHYRGWRQALTEIKKAELDLKIRRRLLSLREFDREDLLLTYVSTPIEVDTIGIIKEALGRGKKVAVPRCIPGTREMEFYLITDLSDLAPGMFHVLEPIPERCQRLEDYSEGLCIAPGLSFDYSGYRLGYGKGYYDRFLSKFGGYTVGICYYECMRWRLPHGRFDCAVDALITEKFIRAAVSVKPKGRR